MYFSQAYSNEVLKLYYNSLLLFFMLISKGTNYLFLYSMYMFFLSILPYKIKCLAYLSFRNQITNMKKLFFKADLSLFDGMMSKGMWLGPVMLYIFCE